MMTGSLMHMLVLCPTGPVMTVIRVAKNSDSEALAMVNSCNYGLGSSVFSGNQVRGTHDRTARHHAGCCCSYYASLLTLLLLPPWPYRTVLSAWVTRSVRA